MLDLLISLRSCARISGALLCALGMLTAPLHCSSFWENDPKPIKHFEQEWVKRYFECLDEDTEIGEVVDFLVSVRESWLARGYECPSLLDLAIRLKEELDNEGIEIDEDDIQEIYEEIYRRERLITPTSFRFAPANYSKPILELCKHKHKHKDKEVKMKSKGVFGFLKALGGGLICILPFPGAQAVGGALIVDGIKDMIEDARETGDENERLQKMDEQRRQEAQLEQSP
jgi:hypothetical protein